MCRRDMASSFQCSLCSWQHPTELSEHHWHGRRRASEASANPSTPLATVCLPRVKPFSPNRYSSLLASPRKPLLPPLLADPPPYRSCAVCLCARLFHLLLSAHSHLLFGRRSKATKSATNLTVSGVGSTVLD